MASELKPWRYEIKYGPEGEDAYSWVYDDHGAMVATMKTHKAKQIVDTMNTRPAPAATDTGLETVAQAYVNEDGECEEIAWIEGLFPHPECIQLVTRSQAEELLSGRDTVIEMQADSIDKLERKVQHWQERADKAGELLAAERAETLSWKQCVVERDEKYNSLYKDFKALKAELDFVGRVKGVNEKYANALAFLEMGENDDPEEFAECFWNKFIAIEAKLAAAEKVKDAMRKAAVDYCWERYKSRAPMNLKDPAVFTSHEWEKIGEAMDAAARAVLGGKPS